MRRVRQKELNHQLKTMGFGGFEDPALVRQMAICIGFHEETLAGKHNHLQKVLLAVEPHLRVIAYEALKPELTFTALPLDRYIIRGQQEAERLKLPVVTKEGKLLAMKDYHGVEKPLDVMAAEAIEKAADDAIADANLGIRDRGKTRPLQHFLGKLRLQCSFCKATAKIKAPDKIRALAAARQDGWRFVERDEKKMIVCRQCVDMAPLTDSIQ